MTHLYKQSKFPTKSPERFSGFRKYKLDATFAQKLSVCASWRDSEILIPGSLKQEPITRMVCHTDAPPSCGVTFMDMTSITRMMMSTSPLTDST